MTRSTRFFEIIQLLRQAKGPVTADQLAEALEVTPRTIYRDIAALIARRVPIHGEAGVGYVLRRGYDLPPLAFSLEEQEAILVGLALLGRTGDRELEQAAARAASKIASALPGDPAEDAALQVSSWHRIPEGPVAAGDLRRFIREEAELEIRYCDLNDRRTSRRVWPLALTYYIDAVVLAAWCHLRQGFRHFRLDRIEDCTPTGGTFAGEAERLRKSWQAASFSQS